VQALGEEMKSTESVAIHIRRGDFVTLGQEDSNAYYVKANIEYDKEQGYPTNYEVVLIKNGDLLQIVKATEL